jgi:hypothetical protein
MNVSKSSVVLTRSRADHHADTTRRCVMTIRIVTGAIISTVLAVAPAAPAQSGVDGREELGRALAGAWLPLERGVAVSASEGTPLSAKYEVEDDVFQLSVYTVKTDGSAGDSFLEVIVDHSAGIVGSVTPISGGRDLAAAEAQRSAMTAARRSIADATAEAVKANAGYRAVSVTPRIDGGRPIADVTLVRGDERKLATVPLD